MSDSHRFSYTPIIVGVVIALLGILTGLYIADNARQQLAAYTAANPSPSQAGKSGSQDFFFPQGESRDSSLPSGAVEENFIDEPLPDIVEDPLPPVVEDATPPSSPEGDTIASSADSSTKEAPSGTEGEASYDDVPVEVDDFEEVELDDDN